MGVGGWRKEASLLLGRAATFPALFVTTHTGMLSGLGRVRFLPPEHHHGRIGQINPNYECQMSMLLVALIHEAIQLWLSLTRNHHHIKLCRRLKPPLIQLRHTKIQTL